MPTVSVHIVTYNSAASIEVCLRALLDQRGVDYSVYLLDNASTDATVAVARGMGVQVTVSETNLGYAAAHNRLLDQTASDNVLTLNPDVQLQPGFLAAMVAAMEAHPQVGSAAGCLLRVEHLGAAPQGMDSLGWVLSVLAATSQDSGDVPQVMDGAGVFMRRSRRQGLIADGLPIAQRPAQITPIFGPDGAAAFYRRAMLDDIRVNGEVFDEDFFMHKEDVDVCWRAQLRGWGALYVPDAVAHHVRGFRPGQRERVSQDMRFLGLRNRYLLMLKNEHPAHFLRDLPFIALYDLGILAYVLLRERASLAAYRSAWALRGAMLTKRRVIQAGRKVDWRTIDRAFKIPRG